MTDYLHKFLKWVSYNRYLVIGILLVAAIIGGVASCTSTTGSLLNPGTQVDRNKFVIEAMSAERGLESMNESIMSSIAEYNAAVEQFNLRVEMGVADLDKQDEIKAQVFAQVESLVTGMINGTFNPGSLVIPGLGLASLIIGSGAYGDKKRTDAILKKAKYGEKTNTTTAA